VTLAASPPNILAPDELRVRPGDDGSVAIDPGRAGWRYLSFSTLRLPAGRPVSLGGDGEETAVVLVAGGDVGATGIGTLAGRASPFDDLPAAAYIPAGKRSTFVATSEAELAVARAPVSGRPGALTEPLLISGLDVAVEVRGAGNATRQINHIIGPEFPADRLLVVEVITPSGNWSSWPPHKHDVDAMPNEAVLEEIYWYRFRRPEGWGIQRVYRRPGTPAFEASGPRDAVWEVRSGDLVIVPDGYHPFVAAHGQDAYYLNALAGDRRTMACSFDPELDWVRGDWATMEPDPRVPVTPARG
jgi:5-deoxy-glucuronate isomerase